MDVPIPGPAWLDTLFSGVIAVLFFGTALWLRTWIWCEHRGHQTPRHPVIWVYQELRDWWQGKPSQRADTYNDTRGAADHHDWTRLP